MLATQVDRFTQPLYNVAEAARFVGMVPSTLRAWARREPSAQKAQTERTKRAVVTVLPGEVGDDRRVPFVGLVEAMVVQAFRQTGLPLQRIRRAVTALADQNELDHALATRRLYTDGANVLYDYADMHADRQLRLLVVGTGQRVFHEVILNYLKRIQFEDEKDNWATSLILPVTQQEVLRATPGVAGGDPVFIRGGAPLSAVRSRHVAGEPLESISQDYDVPLRDIVDAMNRIWPPASAA